MLHTWILSYLCILLAIVRVGVRSTRRSFLDLLDFLLLHGLSNLLVRLFLCAAGQDFSDANATCTCFCKPVSGWQQTPEILRISEGEAGEQCIRSKETTQYDSTALVVEISLTSYPDIDSRKKMAMKNRGTRSASSQSAHILFTHTFGVRRSTGLYQRLQERRAARQVRSQGFARIPPSAMLLLVITPVPSLLLLLAACLLLPTTRPR